MSNYSALKTAIQQAVYTNGNNEITGAGLQSVLLQIVNTVGEGYVFKGVATAGTTPGTPDANVFYIAPAGTYDNFGTSYTVRDGEIGVFAYNGSWNKSKVSVIEIEDSLDSSSTSKALSANQGKELKKLVGEIGTYAENDEWLKVITDNEGKFLFGIRNDGSIEWAEGVPAPVRKSISEVGYFAASNKWVRAVVDENGQVLYGVDADGKFHADIYIEDDILFKHFNALKRKSSDVYVAASNAPQSFKEIADFVCDGVNDEIEISAALNLGGTNAHVILSAGTFHVSSFRHVFSVTGKENYYIGIYVPWYDAQSSRVTIEGNGARGAGGTKIVVDASAFDGVDGKELNVFSSAPVAKYNTLNLKRFSITLPTNQHQVCCVNYQYLGGGIVNELCLYAAENHVQEIAPAVGCVGLRSYMGWDTGTIQIWESVVCIGFYEAFQLGGEHHVLINCGGRYNFYCYTFGNYDYQMGTIDHPILLLNCNDEASQNLPLFVKCGWHDDNAQPPYYSVEKPLQAVQFIALNVETAPAVTGMQKGYAREIVKGAFCGTIEFTAGGGGKNWVDTNHARFWADGEGHNFTTRNLAHAPAGTTAMRLTYFPQYAQQYYDTDLNKQLIYDGTNWRDMMGNIV